MPKNNNNRRIPITAKETTKQSNSPSVYCTAEPGSQEWREYQNERLNSIQVLKAANARKKFLTENVQLINQFRLAARKSKSDTNISNTELDTVDVNGNRKYDVKSNRGSKRRTGILKRSFSTSSTSITGQKHERVDRSNLRWKEPIVQQTPPPSVRVNHNQPIGNKRFLAHTQSIAQKSWDKFPKIMTATERPKANISVSGKRVAKTTRGKTAVNSVSVRPNQSQPSTKNNTKSKSKSELNKDSFTIVHHPIKDKNIPAVALGATQPKFEKTSKSQTSSGGHEQGSIPVPNKAISSSPQKEVSKSSMSIKQVKVALVQLSNAIINDTKTPSPQNPTTALNVNNPPTSLSDFVSKAKVRETPPPFPNLQVCNVLPGTEDWSLYWDSFNEQINQYNQAMDKYSRGMSEFFQELEEYSRKLKRTTLDDLAFQAHLGMRPGDKKPPILRQPLTLPLTLVGPYVIKRNIKNKAILPIPTSVHLTSFDHQSFRMEIGLVPVISHGHSSTSTTGLVEYKALVPNETYFVSIDCKFNMLLVKIELSPKSSQNSLIYKEEVQIAVPPEKSVFTDLQVSSSLQSGGKIIINGR